MLVQYCVLFLAILYLTEAADNCQIPDVQNGECKPIKDCPFLFDYFNRPITRNISDFLRKHHCGFSRKIPKVCCPTATFQTNNQLLNSSCGYFTQGKILGGLKAGLDEFPWMALLEYQRSNGSKFFNCGGVLISKRYVLTAAHCINQLLTSVRLGEYDTSKDVDCVKNSIGEECSPQPINIPVKKAIVHEGYRDEFNQYHDIALIRLKQEVTFSDYIKPICMPSTEAEFNKTYEEEKLFVVGWGVTENNTVSNIKLKVQVPVRNKEFCENTYRRYGLKLNLSENQFCAGGEKGKDSCRGDSGGPLMTVRLDQNKDIQWYAAGVVSFGPMPCGMAQWGGVYTRVSQYVPWIINKLRP